MTILLFGSNGQVGSALLRAFGERSIKAYDRSRADLRHPEALADIVRRERPSVILNAAAYTAVDRAEDEPLLAEVVNVEAPSALAVAAAECDAWLVHYSTDYVFDGEKREPYTETDRTNPLNVYGRTKRDGEAAIVAVGGRHLVLRTSWVHAPRHRNFIATILELATTRTSLRVVDDQIGAPTSAKTIAAATSSIIDAIESGRAPAPGIYHLTASGETSWWSLARFIVATALAEGARFALGPDDVAPIGSADYPQAARRPKYSCLATDKLRAIGVQLPDWKAGALDTIRNSLGAVAS